MTDAEVDALARNILKEVLAEVCKLNPKYFHEILEMQNGEQVPVFAGITPGGLGSFICQYMALESIKAIIKESEKVYDEFQQQTYDDFQQLLVGQPDSESMTDGLDRMFDEIRDDRDDSVKVMAWHITFHLIAFFQTRLSNTIEEAIEDSKFMAEVSIRGRFAKWLNELVPDNTVADIRSELEAVGDKAKKKKKIWLRTCIKGLPSILSERGRGAPTKSPFARQKEREKFLARIEGAYRRLREKSSKRPTKTSVARELGIGGIDPKTGGQSSLQVFRAKLKRNEIDYATLAATIEAELDK